jgi:hypothetical protein
MKSIMLGAAVLTTLIAGGFGVAAAETTKACDHAARTGDTCVCQVRQLHPTQMSIGQIAVDAKAEKLAKKSQDKLVKYLEKAKHHEPVIVGPAKNSSSIIAFYITDHHHLARALLKIGRENAYCDIKLDLRDLSYPQFLERLEKDKKLYAIDAHGNPQPATSLPDSIEGLEDDPYRSLAGAVRDACGFAKQDADFVEFSWAQFFRMQAPPHTGTPITPEQIRSNISAAVKLALPLATSPASAKLPGHLDKVDCKAAGSDAADDDE